MTTPLLYEGGGPNVAQDTLIFRVSSDGFSRRWQRLRRRMERDR